MPGQLVHARFSKLHEILLKSCTVCRARTADRGRVVSVAAVQCTCAGRQQEKEKQGVTV